MYLSSEHHLLPDLQVVPRRRPSPGRWPVSRAVPSARYQTAALSGVWKDICLTRAQHTLLPRLCRRTRQTEQAGLGKEKPG